MPGWHKVVILIGGLVAVAGTVGRAATARPVDTTVPQTVNAPTRPAGTSGYVNDAPSAPALPVQPVPVPQPLSLLGNISPHMQGVGLSLVLGFIIGWFFRAFIKTMALLTFVVFGSLWLLSHYHILNVSDQNIDAMKTESTAAASWLSAKAMGLKDFAIAHLPSSGGGTFGAFLGLRRR